MHKKLLPKVMVFAFIPLISLVLCANTGAADWVPMDSGTSSHIVGIWGTSEADIFAVGTADTILHYDGSTWSQMETWPTAIYYTDVWGSSGVSVFAVGSDGRIVHYDGSSWSMMDSGTEEDFKGVWGSSDTDVFAVGVDGTILHYDGNSWSHMYTAPTRLWAVWGSSDTDVFAVGNGGTILHYDGSNWSVVRSDGAHLEGVGGISETNVFAVGHSGAIFHYDGSTWSPVDSGTSEGLDGVWGYSGTDVYVVGDRGTILHYDGSSWTPEESGTSILLYDIWGSSEGSVFVVGREGTILTKSRGVCDDPGAMVIYGPRMYIRQHAKPEFSFHGFVGPGIAGDYYVCIANGNENGEYRVTSALVVLNGNQVARPRDFGPDVVNLEIPVKTLDANTIGVQLYGQPDTFFTLSVIVIPPPTIQ
jgi:hypothetical protein